MIRNDRDGKKGGGWCCDMTMPRLVVTLVGVVT